MMQELLDAYNKDIADLLAQRAELDEAIAARNMQYAADVEIFVHKDDTPPEPVKKTARKKAAA